MMMFGVSSDDGGGDDCGDEDDLDRGGDFDCCSFRGGRGDGDGDGGQCHVDRQDSKSQLIINLLFLLNKGGIFTFSTVCRRKGGDLFQIAQLNIFHRLPTSQLYRK